MKTALIETMPSKPGDQYSWFFFKLGKLREASEFEKALNLSVDLSDVISNFLAVARGIDKDFKAELVFQKSFLFPEFRIKIIGKDFEIEAEKVFAGGKSRENCMNYKIWINLYADTRERIEQLLDSYKMFGPIPEYSFKGT